MKARHVERHKIGSIGWLRAAVLGANDGIVSTASLILGVAASHASHHSIMVSGLAGLVGGAMSMAAGEYVSVQSQADTESAALATERDELASFPQQETKELAGLYRARGVEPGLAAQVAEQLMAHDALGAHARDELGLSEELSPRPLQAAGASALSFALGATLPLSVVILTSPATLVAWVTGASLVSLAILGGLAANVGGANVMRGVMRVVFWGALSMGLTALIGARFGASV